MPPPELPLTVESVMVNAAVVDAAAGVAAESRVGDGQRAGVVDAAALVSGVAAESGVGDGQRAAR